MKDEADLYTAELPVVAAQPVPEIPLGNIARSLAGLPPLTGAEQAAAAKQPVPAWRTALDAAIAADPRRTAGVALRLGVSRPYVSRVINHHMRAPQEFIDRVTAILMRVECPHLKASLAPAECRTFSARRYQQIGPFEVDHWRACQSCTVKAPPLPVGLPAATTADPEKEPS